jgi:transposase
MGIAALAAEVERLRHLADEAERALVAERAAFDEQKKLVDLQALALMEAKQQVEALTSSNEVLARKLQLIELKLTGRKNERFVEDPAQISLLEPGQTPNPPPRIPGKEDEEEPTPEERKQAIRDRRKASGNGPRRRKVEEMDHLPSRVVPCPMDPAAVCAGCHKPLVVIGQAEAWRINWVPGHFERLHVRRDKCACPACPGEGVLTVPAPFVLPRALCSNGLLAAVLVDKFADHLPLNRQAKRMERQGFDISTAVLAAWVCAVAHPDQMLLSRIAEAIEQELMKAVALMADDTGFPVQDGLNGCLRKGRLWAYTDREQVVFRFTDDKAGHRIATILGKYRGKIILVDGGSEFNQVVRALGLKRGGCWSHLRRYFFDARHHHPVESRLALRTIRDLFMIERALQGASLDRIREVRQQDARPLVEGFFTWVDQVSKTVRPTSTLGEAIGYARNNRATFLAYLDHPELGMHNNLSELMLRGPVVGRKNWMFAGSEGGALAAAVMFTLIGSCQLQAIDPLVYLTDILDRLPFHPANRIHELTPRAWRLAREHAAAEVSPEAA